MLGFADGCGDLRRENRLGEGGAVRYISDGFGPETKGGSRIWEIKRDADAPLLADRLHRLQVPQIGLKISNDIPQPTPSKFSDALLAFRDEGVSV